LNQALAARLAAPGTVDFTVPSEIRARAFSLLMRTYGQVQRAVEYLRWDHGDAQEIAPSVYTGSRGGRRQAAQPADDVVAPAPAVVPNAPVAPHADVPANPQPHAAEPPAVPPIG